MAIGVTELEFALARTATDDGEDDEIGATDMGPGARGTSRGNEEQEGKSGDADERPGSAGRGGVFYWRNMPAVWPF